MPKMKTHRGAAKRFRRTSTGFKHKQTNKNHILTKKALAQATTWVSKEALEEWQQQRDGLNNPMVRFVQNARESFEDSVRQHTLKVRQMQPPLFVSNLMKSRRNSPIVKFVSARRTKAPAMPYF